MTTLEAPAPPKPKAKRTTAKVPGVVILPDADALDAAHVRELRGALAVVTTDEIVREAVLRDCHLPVFDTVKAASVFAKAKARERNGKVCAVVPNYNYGRFLPDALDSLRNQTQPPNEIIIVDDGSTDDSREIAQSWIRAHPSVNARLWTSQANSGNVGGPRNVGIASTDAEFIVTLDSDDMLEPTYIETLYAAIHNRPEVGVVYAGVQSHVQSENRRIVHHDWPIPFDWRWMSAGVNPPHNCIPTASMFRREMWRRAGGYDAARRSAEDAEFWLRGLSVGFEAVKATSAPLFIYRRHGESMSSRAILPLATWSPLHRGLRPLAAPTGEPPVLRDHTAPSIAVIIPVGPGHAEHLPTAIMSVLAQTWWNVEIIVVNDSDDDLPLEPWPFVRVSDTPRPGSGVSVARNIGLRAARAKLAFFLDADDFILPNTLELMARRYVQGDCGYAYSGWWFVPDDGRPPKENIAGDYWPGAWLNDDLGGLHGVSVLISVEDALAIGGFDESMDLFEDGEFFARCAANGLCGGNVQHALLGYRISRGARRNRTWEERGRIVENLRARLGDYIDGRKQPMSCCGGNKTASEQLARDLSFGRTLPEIPIDSDGMVAMAFTGPYEAPVTYNGAAGRSYSGCRSCPVAKVHPDDVQKLADTGVWAVARPELPHTPTPAAIYPPTVPATVPSAGASD